MTSNQISVGAWVSRERVKKKLRDRYFEDEGFRNSKNEENKTRSRQIVSCDGCKKNLTYGSMFSHRKICRGEHEPTPLERLRKIIADLEL